jgi:hypothetical protein
MRTRVLLWAVTLAPLLIAAVGEPPPVLVSFPSDRTQIASPDGKYSIVNVDDDSTDPHHTLYLEDRIANSRKKLLSYGRHVDVLWNPDSTAFAINDFVGSDFAECKVYSIREDVLPVDVATLVTDRELADLQKNHHVYFAVVRWLSPKTLKVKMWGYGDAHPSGFTRFFIVNLSQAPKRRASPKEQPPRCPRFTPHLRR